MNACWMAIAVSLALPGAQPADSQPVPPAPTGVQSADRAQTPDGSQQSSSTLRTGRDLLAACREALQRWARPSGEQVQQAAVELLELYRQLQQDTELAASQREAMRLVVRRRLLNLADQLDRQAAARRRKAAAAQPQPQPETPPTIQAARQMGVLAQQGAWPGMRPGMGMMPGMAAGGMMAPGMFGPMGANQPDDAGEQLADLIRQTIAPEMWIENGGPGSIYYWRPGRALVIRQTDEVHEQIADLLKQLQRAGR